MWSDPNAQKNGRVGQNQHGVDVYGISAFDGKLHGVQCKGKNANYGAQLTEAEIKDESDNADDFDDNLMTFTMATTAPRDENLQEYCRTINESRKHSFTISVWSWDDIEEELRYRSDILRKCQLEYDDSEMDTCSIKLSRITSKERLLAFMTRPVIKAVTSVSMRQLLYKVFYEIMQNAFIHGHATHCALLYEANRFTLMDDGTRFDPNRLLANNGSGGSITLTRLLTECKDSVKPLYYYKNQMNVYTLVFQPEALSKGISNKVEIIVNQYFEIQSRVEAKQLAINQMSTLSPLDDVCVLFSDIIALSNIREYVSSAVKLIGPQRITISLHQSQGGLIDSLKEYTPNVVVRE